MSLKSDYLTDEKGNIHFELLESPDLEKPFAIFLHGASPNSQHTKFWEPINDITIKYCNPVYMDRFGHGDSNSEDKIGIRDHFRTIKELAEFIRNEYDQNQVILIGRSQGGAFAVRIASEYPNLISGLGLIAPGSMKTNSEYLKNWNKPLVVLWDELDPVVDFKNFKIIKNKVPHVKLYLINEGKTDENIDRDDISKTHTPELAAPELYEKFLDDLVSQI